MFTVADFTAFSSESLLLSFSVGVDMPKELPSFLRACASAMALRTRAPTLSREDWTCLGSSGARDFTGAWVGVTVEEDGEEVADAPK